MTDRPAGPEARAGESPAFTTPAPGTSILLPMPLPGGLVSGHLLVDGLYLLLNSSDRNVYVCIGRNTYTEAIKNLIINMI